MDPSFAELKYFAEVCHTLNLSRAAERLGISQPSLSLAIKRLEQSVGTALLVRHKQGVSLTQAGKQLMLHARQLLQYWEKTKSTALASWQEVQGYFTLGCNSTIAIYLVSQFLPNLLQKYPKLEVHLKHDISRKITEQVINLSIDIGIVVNPIKHPDLIIRKICQDETTFWTTPQFYKSFDFNSDSLVIYCDPELTQTQKLLKKLLKNNQRIITMNGLEVVAALTAQGNAVGILPERLVKALYPNQLKKIPNMPVYSDEVCLIYRNENRQVAAMQAIIASMKK